MSQRVLLITVLALLSLTLATYASLARPVPEFRGQSQTIPPLTLTIKPAAVAGGHNAVGTITLASPAPSNGLVVTLVSNSKFASLAQTNQTVLAGKTMARFLIKTQSVDKDTNVTLTARSGGLSSSAAFTVSALRLSSLQCAPDTVKGGQSILLTISLNRSAPTAGTVVSLTSSNPMALPVPKSITIPGGSSAVSIQVDTALLTKEAKVTITGTLGTVSTTTTLGITP